MKPYWEMHVTFLDRNFTSEPDDSTTWRFSEPSIEGWKFTKIAGDPDLGPGTKGYLTRQRRGDLPECEVVREVDMLGDTLEMMGYDVLRTKVERVVHDNRRKKS